MVDVTVLLSRKIGYLPTVIHSVSVFAIIGQMLLAVIVSFFFFFSSRRRHTRCGRDWSSDVCSSDLEWTWQPDQDGRPFRTPWRGTAPRWPAAHICGSHEGSCSRLSACRLGCLIVL